MKKNNRAKLENFFSKGELKSFSRNQVIVKPNGQRGHVYLEKEGWVRAYSIGDKGEERTLPMLDPMFYCGILDFWREEKTDFYYETITDAEVWQVERKDFWSFLEAEENKELYEDVVKEVIGRLGDLTCNMHNLTGGEARSKVANLIYMLIKRFGVGESGQEMPFNLPHRVMASMLGLTRETVTLQILQMEKEGILKKRGRNLIVEDMKKLEEIL